MRSTTTELSQRIRMSAEVLVDALRQAAAELSRGDLTSVLVTAISVRYQMDAAIISIVGADDGITDQEQLHRQRHLDITEMPGGGYVLAGYLDPRGGLTVKRALDAMIERKGSELETTRREPGGVSRPPALPLSSAASTSSTDVHGATKHVKMGRDDACPCGSARKHKYCCGA